MFSSKILHKAEPVLFWIILFLHLIPVITNIPFPTLDGPAHLYNSNLINWLISNQTSPAATYFQFNTFPEPNWTGHLLMMFFLQLFSAEMSSLLLVVLIILMSAIGYRRLLLAFDSQSAWLSWLNFPFIYNFTFCLGFFNFSIAVALLPWILLWWIKRRNNLTLLAEKKQWASLILPKFQKGKGGIFFLMLFMMVIYFSHLVIFLIAGLFMGLISLSDRRVKSWKEIMPQLLLLAIATLPGLLLSAWFIHINSNTAFHGEEIAYLPIHELFDFLLKARMFVVYTYENESTVSQLFLWMLIPLTLLGLKKRTVHQYQKPFLQAAILSLAMVFIIPDSLSSGGILSVRIVQLFFMMWCIWLATLNLPFWSRPIAAIIAVSLSGWFMIHHQQTRKTLAEEGKMYFNAGRKMKSGSVVLPLNYSSNWLSSNQPCFMGASNRLVILDNYEASQTHFPLVWKKGMNPEINLGNFAATKQPWINIQKSEKATGIKIDYVVSYLLPMNPEDSCTKDALKQLTSLFRPVFEDKNRKLIIFKRID